jgi:chemotaxis protein methyltransferase CheR
MTTDERAFAALSRQFAKTSGFAVDAYKDKCIRRRIAVRMRACGVHSYEDYRMLLDRSPNEYERLRDALTINVTRFYRNAETWSLIRRDVLPALLDGRRREVRAWRA